MVIRLSSVKSSFHLFQAFNKSSGNVSSQWRFSCQVVCKTLFAGNRTGPIITRGSKIELNLDKHRRRVSFPGRPDVGDVLTPNVSVSRFHCGPRALSIGNKFVEVKILDCSFLCWDGSQYIFVIRDEFSQAKIPFA